MLGACASTGNSMSFFVTSANPGKGGDLGGLAGADKYCQTLATSAGAGSRTWRAYLSNAGMSWASSVNARDRIGSGPWFNAKGERVAFSVDDLHSAGNNLNKKTALSEKGEVIMGRGDAVNMHDILTGSSSDGRAIASDKDTTCGNWTLSTGGSAMVGHHDRQGLTDTAEAKSWNTSHPSRACDMASLKATGGAGLMYCFAR
ncbi:MAG: hypothetical protein V4614_14525 [Pseudomonadota bacterium]